MRGGCENSKSTVVFSGYWPMSGTVVCVSAAGWPTMFTTFTGGVRRLVTGGSDTTVYGVFVESATHLDMNERIDE